MALGGNYDNNSNKDTVYKPTVYSPYGFSNPYSKVDPSRISFSFWNRMLKITITPVSGKDSNGAPIWDNDNAGCAHLTHTKARILSDVIKKFLANPEENTGSGIISNETLVTVSNGAEFNTEGLFLVIRKLDKENHNLLSSYAYEFNSSFHCAIKGYNESDSSYDFEYDSYRALEVEQFIELLDTYVSSMTYSAAYAYMDAQAYSNNYLVSLLRSCADALGVSNNKGGNENSSYNNRNNRRAGSSFSGSGASANSNGRNVQHMSPEDIEEDLFG